MPQKKWMQHAFNPAHKGELHQYLGVPQNRKIGRDRLMALAHNPKVPLAYRKRAWLALIAVYHYRNPTRTRAPAKKRRAKKKASSFWL